MAICLDQYRITKAAKVIATVRYFDQEKLCVNGNLTIGGIAMSRKQNSNDLSFGLPEDFTKVDAKTFFHRVYALATQI